MGRQLEPPAMISWSPRSDAFFVNEGEGSGLSSSFRLFRVKETHLSEDMEIEKKVIALFRRRVLCDFSAVEPNIWGFGWDTEGNEIYLLVQPTVNDSCGRQNN
jgi:hypothetical protein